MDCLDDRERIFAFDACEFWRAQSIGRRTALALASPSARPGPRLSARCFTTRYNHARKFSGTARLPRQLYERLLHAIVGRVGPLGRIERERRPMFVEQPSQKLGIDDAPLRTGRSAHARSLARTRLWIRHRRDAGFSHRRSRTGGRHCL